MNVEIRQISHIEIVSNVSQAWIYWMERREKSQRKELETNRCRSQSKK